MGFNFQLWIKNRCPKLTKPQFQIPDLPSSMYRGPGQRSGHNRMVKAGGTFKLLVARNQNIFVPQ